MVDLLDPTGPCSRRMRFSVPYPWAADLKKSTNCSSGRSSPKMASAPLSIGSAKKW